MTYKEQLPDFSGYAADIFKDIHNLKEVIFLLWELRGSEAILLDCLREEIESINEIKELTKKYYATN